MSKEIETRKAPEGFLNAVIMSVEKKDYSTKDGRSFSKILFSVVAEGERTALKGSMSVEYATKYFNFCGVKGSELVGKPCYVSVRDEVFLNKAGDPCTARKIRFLNLIDEDGNRLLLPRDEKEPSAELPF